MKRLIKRFIRYFGIEIKAKKKAIVPTRFLDSYVSNPECVDEKAIVQYSNLRGEIKVGRNALIHDTVIYGNVSIGRNTSISGSATEIHSFIHPITIGKFCSIARGTTIQEVNHQSKTMTSYYIHKHIFKKDLYKDMASKGPITIGHDVWIGAANNILTGVTIGNGAIIAANSVVNTDVPDYAIFGGTPAKLISYRFDDAIIKVLQTIKWWDWDEERIKRNYHLFDGDLTIEKLKNILD
ncbi:hypothetical protein I5M32_03800 [Pedobacter sp. SD-b]|uniref:Acetyltransferase (Isoleucine patch superfamily) n=1 Tax=Pedobacter segetis TaxID=2793069 RepID=A0ABS1BIP4_9SPHI|nr:CatB-related O-acetyltransferase [Pedobacter segetis]MBK0382074.1 hypothetical protein [Pedobacter segetis]